MDSLRPQYTFVDRMGGAGDKGRDVVGHVNALNSNGPWDNYQCKHYDSSLKPSDIWVEIGKMCYYTFVGDYPWPRKYRFVAPRGVGTKLQDYLRVPAKLKAEFLAKWGTHCANEISSTAIPLTSDLRAHIQALDFSIFEYIPVFELVKQHQATQYYLPRFGAPSPVRPAVVAPPVAVQPIEFRYIAELLRAYGDNLHCIIADHNDSALEARHKGHFARSRQQFFEAESLNRFSRDQVAPGAFEKLKEEIYAGVVDTAESQHADGFDCVIAVADKAQNIVPTSNALRAYLTVGDKRGVCFHLSNDGKLVWVK